MNDLTSQCLAAKYLSSDQIAMQFLHYSDSEPPSHYSDPEKSMQSTAENRVTGEVQLLNEDEDLQTIWNFAQRSKFYAERLPVGSQTPEVLSQVESSTDCGTTEIDHISDGGDCELDDPLILSLVHSLSCCPEVQISPMGAVTSESLIDRIYPDEAKLEMTDDDQINADAVSNPHISWDVKEDSKGAECSMSVECLQNEDDPAEDRSATDPENHGASTAPVYTDGGSTSEISQDLCATAEPEDKELLSTGDLPKVKKTQKTSKQPCKATSVEHARNELRTVAFRPETTHPGSGQAESDSGQISLPQDTKGPKRTKGKKTKDLSATYMKNTLKDEVSTTVRAVSPEKKQPERLGDFDIPEVQISCPVVLKQLDRTWRPSLRQAFTPTPAFQSDGQMDANSEGARSTSKTYIEPSTVHYILKPQQQAAWMPSLWTHRHN